MPITYDGTLPSWITLDVESSRLVGAANTFMLGNKALANVAAQQALNDFAAAAIEAGTLNCGGGAGPLEITWDGSHADFVRGTVTSSFLVGDFSISTTCEESTILAESCYGEDFSNGSFTNSTGSDLDCNLEIITADGDGVWNVYVNDLTGASYLIGPLSVPAVGNYPFTIPDGHTVLINVGGSSTSGWPENPPAKFQDFVGQFTTV